MPADVLLHMVKLWTKVGLLPGLSDETCQLLALPRRAPACQSDEVHAAQRVLACNIVQACTAHAFANRFGTTRRFPADRAPSPGRRPAQAG